MKTINYILYKRPTTLQHSTFSFVSEQQNFSSRSVSEDGQVNTTILLITPSDTFFMVQFSPKKNLDFKPKLRNRQKMRC